MSFASPLWLLALALIGAVVIAGRLARRRARRYAVRFPALATLAQAARMTPDRARHLPAVGLLAAAAALALALAHPQLSGTVAVRQASLVLVLDHSGSMAAADVKPTRLAAARGAAETFLKHLPASVRVGVVDFSNVPDTLLSPTTDRAAARRAIDAQVAVGATATGDALQAAMNMLTAPTGKQKGRSAIVLLSDGAANAGQDPVAVAAAAGRENIVIDTVALGTAAGTLANPDPFEPGVAVPPDPQLMQAIARASHGRSFSAQDAGRLNAIYSGLGVRLGSRPTQHDITIAFIAGGLVLLLLSALAGVRRSPRLP